MLVEIIQTETQRKKTNQNKKMKERRKKERLREKYKRHTRNCKIYNLAKELAEEKERELMFKKIMATMIFFFFTLKKDVKP